MSAELEAAAKSAGLVDLTLLKIAETDLAPADAVAGLRRLYPGAFHCNDARKMNDAEAGAALRDLLGQNTQAVAQRRRDHVAAELTRPDVRGSSQADYQRRLADYLRGIP